MKERFWFRAWDKKSQSFLYFGIATVSILVEKFSRLIIEQCTGLKDKNGVLIYEGDIVKFYEHNYEVYFNENTSAMDIWNEKKELGYSLYYHEELEVIGNIHKNPDLLKGE